MADNHNTARYGETWHQYKIEAYMEVLKALKHSVVLSGGWAWHFMSPEGHVEYKHAHDHKDVDLMVPLRTVWQTTTIIKDLGFAKVGTRYDHLPSAEDFRRYEKEVSVEGQQPFRITIDFFVKDVPVLQCKGGWLVVRPDVLISYYSTIHSSKSCFAVQAAKALLDTGVDPESLLGNPKLLGLENIPKHQR